MASESPSKPGIALALAFACLCACDGAREQASEGGGQVAAKPAPVRCEDFITKADLTALGLIAEPYSEVTDPSKQIARCSLGEVSAAIFRGDKFGKLVDGIKLHGKASGVAAQEGPVVGAETQWTTMPGSPETGGKERHTLNFLPPNRKFTASVTGSDKSKVEQVANALLAKFQTM